MDILLPFLGGGAGTFLVLWLGRIWITERLRRSIEHEYAERTERLRAELRADVERRLAESSGELDERYRLARERWRLKRRACLKALDVIDRVLTQANYPNSRLVPEWRDVTVDELREVYNHLALSLDKRDVLDLYCALLGFRSENDPEIIMKQSIIQEFRNAIRRELGFGTDLDLDKERVWIAVHLTHPRSDRVRP